MPQYRITAPDGSAYDVTAPEGATEQDALAKVQEQHMQAQPTTQLTPAAGAHPYASAVSKFAEMEMPGDAKFSGFAQRVLGAESSQQNPLQVSPKGAVGPMQVKEPAFREVMPKGNFKDPMQQAQAGVKYLAKYYKINNGDEPLTASMYNAGPGATYAAGGVAQNPETQNYVAKVATPPGANLTAGGPAAPPARSKGTFRPYERPRTDIKPPVAQTLPGPAPLWQRAAESGYGGLEAALSTLSGMSSFVPGGARGLYGMATGEDPQKTVAAQEAISRAMTYEPRTPEGRQAAPMLGSLLSIPQRPAEAAGQYLAEQGHPWLATGARILLDPMTLLPAGAAAVRGLRVPAPGLRVEPTMRGEVPAPGGRPEPAMGGMPEQPRPEFQTLSPDVPLPPDARTEPPVGQLPEATPAEFKNLPENQIGLEPSGKPRLKGPPAVEASVRDEPAVIEKSTPEEIEVTAPTVDIAGTVEKSTPAAETVPRETTAAQPGYDLLGTYRQQHPDYAPGAVWRVSQSEVREGGVEGAPGRRVNQVVNFDLPYEDLLKEPARLLRQAQMERTNARGTPERAAELETEADAAMQRLQDATANMDKPTEAVYGDLRNADLEEASQRYYRQVREQLLTARNDRPQSSGVQIRARPYDPSYEPSVPQTEVTAAPAQAGLEARRQTYERRAAEAQQTIRQEVDRRKAQVVRPSPEGQVDLGGGRSFDVNEIMPESEVPTPPERKAPPTEDQYGPGTLSSNPVPSPVRAVRAGRELAQMVGETKVGKAAGKVYTQGPIGWVRSKMNPLQTMPEEAHEPVMTGYDYRREQESAFFEAQRQRLAATNAKPNQKQKAEVTRIDSQLDNDLAKNIPAAQAVQKGWNPPQPTDLQGKIALNEQARGIIAKHELQRALLDSGDAIIGNEPGYQKIYGKAMEAGPVDLSVRNEIAPALSRMLNARDITLPGEKGWRQLMAVWNVPQTLMMWSPGFHTVTVGGRMFPYVGKMNSILSPEHVRFARDTIADLPAYSQLVKDGLQPMGRRFANVDVGGVPGAYETAMRKYPVTKQTYDAWQWMHQIMPAAVDRMQLSFYSMMKKDLMDKGTPEAAAKTIAIRQANNLSGNLPKEEMGRMWGHLMEGGVFSKGYSSTVVRQMTGAIVNDKLLMAQLERKGYSQADVRKFLEDNKDQFTKGLMLDYVNNYVISQAINYTSTSIDNAPDKNGKKGPHFTWDNPGAKKSEVFMPTRIYAGSKDGKEVYAETPIRSFRDMYLFMAQPAQILNGEQPDWLRRKSNPTTRFGIETAAGKTVYGQPTKGAALAHTAAAFGPWSDLPYAANEAYDEGSISYLTGYLSSKLDVPEVSIINALGGQAHVEEPGAENRAAVSEASKSQDALWARAKRIQKTWPNLNADARKNAMSAMERDGLKAGMDKPAITKIQNFIERRGLSKSGEGTAERHKEQNK